MSCVTALNVSSLLQVVGRDRKNDTVTRKPDEHSLVPGVLTSPVTPRASGGLKTPSGNKDALFFPSFLRTTSCNQVTARPRTLSESFVSPRVESFSLFPPTALMRCSGSDSTPKAEFTTARERNTCVFHRPTCPPFCSL